MDNLYEMIKKADGGDVEAQMIVANHIIWEEKDSIEPDWAEKALHYYKCAAEQGNSDALIEIGTMYRLAKGVDRDLDKAFYWLKKAAAALNPRAYRYLGYALEIPVGYLDDNDETADYKTAFDYFFKGTMLGDPDSYYKVGDMYFTGKFIDIDKQFAACLYLESDSLNNYSSASVNLRLGECYCKGLGVDKDNDKAVEHLECALEVYESYIENGVAPEFFMGGYNRVKLLLRRIKGGKYNNETSKQIRTKEDNGYTEFINSDNMLYPKPDIEIAEIEQMKADKVKIIRCSDGKKVSFSRALRNAEKGDIEAMYSVAFHFFSNFGDISGRKDIVDLSLYYYHKAIRSGHKRAMYNLAAIYSFGENGVPIDRAKAFKLYQYSDTIYAIGELGVFYAKGEIVDQDYEKAYKCFADCTLRCKLFDMSENYGPLKNLARMYREGIFVEKDEAFADYCDKLGDESKKIWDAKYDKRSEKNP